MEKESSAPKLDRLAIYCDGSNWVPSLRDAGIAYAIDIPRLARMLATLPPTYLLTQLYYYTAPTPSREARIAAAQQRFFEILRQSRNTTLVLGRHESRGGFHVEKETDVNLSVDMVVGAYENKYDVAMLVAGDTDYVRAVKAVKAIGKRVIWIHFSTHRHCDELKQICDSSFELTEKLLRTCRRSDPY